MAETVSSEDQEDDGSYWEGLTHIISFIPRKRCMRMIKSIAVLKMKKLKQWMDKGLDYSELFMMQNSL